METVEEKKPVPVIKPQLVSLLREDKQVQEAILHTTSPEYLSKTEGETRFYALLAELQRMREESEKRWEESNKKWEELKQESERKWEELKQESERKWQELKQESERNAQENARKWEESNKKWQELKQESERNAQENARKWEESNKKWEESNQKWQELKQESERNAKKSDQRFEALMSEIIRLRNDSERKFQSLERRYESTIGALGARWGIAAESSFRDAMAAILHEVSDLKVAHVIEKDEEGFVFGKPEQVELDIIIHNGSLIIVEIKSSMSRGEMYLFERKARFYERKHHGKADRLIVVSPMTEESARQLAQEFGIEVYSYIEEMLKK